MVRELGRCGMATVYLAADAKLGRRLALQTRGHAVLSGFGITKVEGECGATTDGTTITGTGLTVDTAKSMSPERRRGVNRIDAHTAVYGLAAGLYEMLAGERPFTGPSVQ